MIFRVPGNAVAVLNPALNYFRYEEMRWEGVCYSKMEPTHVDTIFLLPRSAQYTYPFVFHLRHLPPFPIVCWDSIHSDTIFLLPGNAAILFSQPGSTFHHVPPVDFPPALPWTIPHLRHHYTPFVSTLPIDVPPFHPFAGNAMCSCIIYQLAPIVIPYPNFVDTIFLHPGNAAVLFSQPGSTFLLSTSKISHHAPSLFHSPLFRGSTLPINVPPSQPFAGRLWDTILFFSRNAAILFGHPASSDTTYRLPAITIITQEYFLPYFRDSYVLNKTQVPCRPRIHHDFRGSSPQTLATTYAQLWILEPGNPSCCTGGSYGEPGGVLPKLFK